MSPKTKTLRDISKKQKYKCKYCKRRTTFKTGHHRQATLDHIVPRSDGGTDDESNLLMVCKNCNENKSSLSRIEFEFIHIFSPPKESFKLDYSARPYIEKIIEETIDDIKGKDDECSPMMKFLVFFLVVYLTLCTFGWYFFWHRPRSLSPLSIFFLYLILFGSVAIFLITS